MTFLVEGLSKHLEPKKQVRHIGEYETVAEAIAVAKAMVDTFLHREFKSGMDAKTLYSLYTTRGECPFIFLDDHSTVNLPGFNHVRYAMSRANEICRGKK
jgi:hypothetical protein